MEQEYSKTDIASNIRSVQAVIQAACGRTGRSADEVTLMAVSKTKPAEMLLEARAAGLEVFGENYVQELCDKMETLPHDFIWHMIGHLQRNKVKYLVGKVSLIHSVDSFRLAEQIEKEAAKADVIQDILLEINVAEEESKWGFTLDNALEAVKTISAFPHLHIRGFMTSAPYTLHQEENRLYFRQLKTCFDAAKMLSLPNVSMEVLSMGMTGDYEVAVEEGATLVRVGTGIFGARDYTR